MLLGVAVRVALGVAVRVWVAVAVTVAVGVWVAVQAGTKTGGTTDTTTFGKGLGLLLIGPLPPGVGVAGPQAASNINSMNPR